jgi:choline dehydrogenase-like flavoprotein
MLARLYRDGGQTVTLGNPPIALPLGRGLGGTTLVNSGTCFTTPAPVLERWQREIRPGGPRAGRDAAVLRAG